MEMLAIDTFSGNNSTTAFTLTLDPGDENNTRVFIDGVYQSKSNYTVSGTTLTFSSAPPSGTSIEVEIGNRVVTLDTLSDLDLPDNVKLRLGTSQDLEIYHDASDSLINDNGTGSLKLQTGGSTKLEVTSTGVDVTGNIAVLWNCRRYRYCCTRCSTYFYYYNCWSSTSSKQAVQ